MKKIVYIILSCLVMISCENQEIEFPDFDYNAVYFPLQYPVRTLVLGEDRIDNSRDKELKFLIGAVIGGMYNNSTDRHVDFIVDESLAQNLVRTNGDTIRTLPSAYYSITPANQITIPKGSYKGTVEVQLTQDFLNDPLAVTGGYVIPLRMTGTDADSILSGLPMGGIINPDKRVASDWDASSMPKDFVLFGIKYINPYHGAYFQRGKDIAYQLDGLTPVDTIIYHNKYIEYDQIRTLTTIAKSTCSMNGIGQYKGGSYKINLIFNEEGSIKIDSVATSSIKASGTGVFLDDGDTWGGEQRNTIYLQYEYIRSNQLHKVNDTLVFRNNGVVFEENTIRVIN